MKRTKPGGTKNMLTYMMNMLFISLCVSHLNIFICILPYHDGFSRHKTTVSAQIVIHRNFADLLYCTCAVRYCTVLYCTYCTDADKMMNRLINCPTDCRIR